MACVIKQRVGNNTYLYESVSYRDEKGYPRCRRKTIGKLEKNSGLPVYKREYIERMAKEGKRVENPPTVPFNIDGIKNNSAIKNPRSKLRRTGSPKGEPAIIA
jgi:hypothetical protein